MISTVQTEMYAFKVDGYNVTVVRSETELREDDQVVDINALKARMVPIPYIQNTNEAVERDADYYLEMVEFAIEDTLYSAPKALLPIPGHLGSGSSSPVTTSGLCTSDIEAVFAFLLSASLPPLSDPATPLSNEQWLQLLKCASAWGITAYKDLAISQVDGMQLSDVDRLTLGREYSNKAWVMQAYRSMAMRGGPLTIDEVAALGLLSSTRIVGLRETMVPQVPLSSGQGQVSIPPQGSVESGSIWIGIDEMCQGLAELASSVPVTLSGSNSDIHRVQIALDEGILDWAKSSFTEIIQRQQQLSMEEVETLNLSRRCLLDISNVREYQTRRSRRRGPKSAIPTSDTEGNQLIDQAFQQFLADSFPSVKLAPASPASRLVLALAKGYQSWMIHECGKFLACTGTIPFSEVEILGMPIYAYLAHHKECFSIRTSRPESRKLETDKLALITQWVDEEMGSG